MKLRQFSLVRVKGNSMYPTMKNGSIWFCYKCKNIKIGDIVVVYSQKLDKYVVKRIGKFNANGDVFLKSDNKKIATIDGDKLGYIDQKLILGRCYFRVL